MQRLTFFCRQTCFSLTFTFTFSFSFSFQVVEESLSLLCFFSSEMKSIVLALLFLVQYSCADYLATTYYSSSGCSGTPTYYTATTSGSDCSDMGCTEGNGGAYFTISCSSGVPSIPGGIISLWEYSTSDCSGSPTYINGYPSSCTDQPGDSGDYNYATCTNGNATFYLGCSNSKCSDCGSATYSTTCTKISSGSSYKAQCASAGTTTTSPTSTTSSASFSVVNVNLLVMQVLTVAAALRRYY